MDGLGERMLRRYRTIGLIAIGVIGLVAVTANACRTTPSLPGPATEASATPPVNVPASATPTPTLAPTSTLTPTPTLLPSTTTLYGVRLPTTAAALVTEFGEPVRVDLPSEESLSLTPDGQWFRWTPRGDTFSALNEEYSRTVRRSSPVSYIQVMANRGGTPSPTVFGFLLNKSSRSAVEHKFRGKLRPCEGRFGDQAALKIHSGKTWWFFFFSKDRLVGVGQGTFDLDNTG